MQALIDQLTARVRAAAAAGTPLRIHAGDSKAFHGGACDGEPLDLAAYAGIVDYEPRELVLTVRAGTTLAEIETALAREGQILPFEPPAFSSTSTIGGTVACGFSGPRRPYAGAVRDFVLGARIIDGKGQTLSFGGRVIKNVAGYDVSRLMVGAMGTLGILLDLSFKVLPRPVCETTLRFEYDEATAIRRFNEWAGQPIPLSATSWCDGIASVRLSGTEAGVRAAAVRLGGESLPPPPAEQHWSDLRHFRDARRAGATTLWRVSVPPTTPPLALDGAAGIEWGGGLRWFAGHEETAYADALRAAVTAVGGHATLFRGGDKTVGVFHPLAPALAVLHRRLKAAFDPFHILNRGRMDNF